MPNIILLDPNPRPLDLIFSPQAKQTLEGLGAVRWHEGPRATAEQIDPYLPETVALIGQTALDKARLDRSPKLKVIANVEGNFLPNIDYDECHRRNIHVLSCAPAFAPAVAEHALGLALACTRGIVANDFAFREGKELYSGGSNKESFLLRGKVKGLIGCGNVGQRMLPLLRAFGGEIVVHDPWLHENLLKDFGVRPVGLEEVLRTSRVLFIMSAATTENKKGLSKQHFEMMQPGSVVVLVGRAETVDFDALMDACASGHIKAAVDVFPQEPLLPDHRARKTPNMVLSGHRAGGLPETYRDIGQMVVDDLSLILRGLPPQRMQKATPETVSRYRGMPVSADLSKK